MPLIIFFLLAFFSLFLAINNKLLILAFLLFLFSLFFVFKHNLREAFFLGLLFVLPFERGIRDWIIEVVPSGPDFWFEGYSFYFAFSLKAICVLMLILLFFLKRGRKGSIKSKPALWLLVCFFLTAVISTLTTEDFNLTLLGLVRLTSTISIFFISLYFFDKKALRKDFRTYIVALLFFLGFIGSWQLVSGHPIGIFLEETTITRPFGYRTTDGVELYRVSGLMGHPTFFAAFLSLLFVAGVCLLLNELRKGKKRKFLLYFYTLSVVLGAIALFGTFSRSAWIAVFLSLAIICFKVFKNRKFKNIISNYASKPFFIILFSMLIGVFFYLFGSQFVFRLNSFRDIWITGNGRGRLNLMIRSWQMVQDFPLFGVGLNRFTKAIMDYNLSLEEKTFLYPVHNTFLLFFAETGIFGGFLFFGFFAFCLSKIYKKASKNWLNFGIWLAVFTFFINAQFHTLFSLDPSLDLTMVMMAYLLNL